MSVTFESSMNAVLNYFFPVAIAMDTPEIPDFPVIPVIPNVPESKQSKDLKLYEHPIMKNVHVCSNVEVSDASDVYDLVRCRILRIEEVTLFNCTFLSIDMVKHFRMSKLTFRNCDFSNMRSFQRMFYENRWLENIEFKSCKIETIESMSQMFRRCMSLERVRFIDSKTTSLREMNSMFQECQSLKCVDGLSELDVSNVKNIDHLFRSCWELKDLNPIKHWDVSKVESMNATFCGCSSLTSLAPLLEWNTGYLQCFIPETNTNMKLKKVKVMHK